jgi:two-component system sensor histidine kinase UhpB
MHLVTRLLYRLMLISLALLLLALVVIVYSAQQDIGRETAASLKIGQLIEVTGELQSGADLDQQVHAIDALNRAGALRHFHLALYAQDGRLLTALPAPGEQPTSLTWLNQFLTRAVVMTPYRLPLVRADGQRLTAVLQPDPYSESVEAVHNASIWLALYAALTCALVGAIWVSVTHAFSPLRDILGAIAQFENGNFNARLKTIATKELNQIGQALNHLAASLTEHIATQRDLLHRLQDAQEGERRKLAHELHDEFGQILTAMQVDASYLVRQCGNQPALQACAQAMYDNSSLILTQVKGILAQLRPYGLQGSEDRDIALEQALTDLVNTWHNRPEQQLRCTLQMNLQAVTMPQPLAVALYRITQEALTNVMRHARARHVDIRLRFDAARNAVLLSVSDDGIGLPDERIIHAQGRPAGHPGLGMAGIRERVIANNGSLRLQANAPHGLLLEVVFPLDPPAPVSVADQPRDYSHAGS